MCFALPFHITEIHGKTATNNQGKKIKLDLVGQCSVGEYVLVQADIAIEKIDKERAQAIAQQMKKSSQ